MLNIPMKSTTNGPRGRKDPSELATRMPNRLQKAQESLILSLYSEGRTPEQIAIQLNMNKREVKTGIRRALDHHLKLYATPSPEHNFVKYASFQYNIIQKLQSACDMFLNDPDTKQYSALVSAYKAQSDIYDKIMAKGQELNVIQKRSASDDIRMTSKDIKEAVVTQITTLEKLVTHIDERTGPRVRMSHPKTSDIPIILNPFSR